MQFSAVDKTKAWTFEMSQRHIDINPIRVLLKIDDLDRFVPVMFDRKWNPGRIGFRNRLVKRTWKTEASMLPCFFQGRRKLTFFFFCYRFFLLHGCCRLSRKSVC